MEVLFGEEKMVISWSSFVQAAILDPPYSIASHTPCIANTINLHLASLEVGGGGGPSPYWTRGRLICIMFVWIGLQITNGMSSFFFVVFWKWIGIKFNPKPYDKKRDDTNLLLRSIQGSSPPFPSMIPTKRKVYSLIHVFNIVSYMSILWHIVVHVCKCLLGLYIYKWRVWLVFSTIVNPFVRAGHRKSSLLLKSSFFKRTLLGACPFYSYAYRV